MQYGDAVNDSFGKLKLTPRPSPSKLSKEDVKSKPQSIMQVRVHRKMQSWAFLSAKIQLDTFHRNIDYFDVTVPQK